MKRLITERLTSIPPSLHPPTRRKSLASTRLILLAALIALSGQLSPGPRAQWSDPAGDVTFPNADIISGSASIGDGMVDLRLSFLAAPFPMTHTQAVSWLFDIDQNPLTTNPFLMKFPGADRIFQAHVDTDDDLATGIPGVDLCLHGSIDAVTNTLRILFPSALLPGVSRFYYGVTSDFGGSFGANEAAPDLIQFAIPGGRFLSNVGSAPPFQGESVCTGVRAVRIDVRPGGSKHNIIPFNSGGLVDVAILSESDFDAPAEVDPATLTFGRFGRELSFSSCDAGPQDVDGDGLDDLVCSFHIALTGLVPGDAGGVLRGNEFDGLQFRGSDFLQVVGTIESMPCCRPR